MKQLLEQAHLDGKGFGADELHFDNLDLRAFGDLKGNGGLASLFVQVENAIHLRPWNARLLVQFLDGPRVGEQLLLVERVAHFGSEFLAQFGVVEFTVAFEPDVGHARLGLDDVRQHHALRCVGLSGAEVVEQAGGVKIDDVFVDSGRRVRVAHLDANVGPDQVVTYRRRAYVVDFDLGNLLAGDLRPGGGEQAHSTEQESGCKSPWAGNESG